MDITDTPSVFTTQDIGGVTYTSVGHYSADDGKLSLFYKLSDELKAGESYTISFNVFRATGMEGFSEVYFALSDSPTQFDDVVNIASFSTSGISKGGSQRFSIQFTYPENKFNGKQCYILCSILSPKGYSLFYLSDIVFTNNNQTDDKIDGILEWLSAVYHSIVGGEDSRGVKHDGLVQGIKNGLNGLGDRISSFFDRLSDSVGGFFSDLFIKLKGWFDNIGNWFSELGEKISNKFDEIKVKITNTIVALGEDIIEGLKRLFIPSEDFLNDKLDEFLDVYEDHFGIFAQGTIYFTNAIRKVDSVLSDSYSFVFPELSVTIVGKKYVFSEQQTVDINQWLKSGTWSANLYEMYRVFASAFLIYLVLLYARKVEAVILNNTPELAEQFDF